MCSGIAAKDLLLVGSIPFDTSEEVFRAVSGSGVADALPFLPSQARAGRAPPR